MPGPASTPDHPLDVLARAHGFPDYATWAAWQGHQSDAIHQGSNTTTQAGPAAAPRNYLQNALGPAYPPAMFRWISDRYARATGQQP